MNKKSMISLLTAVLASGAISTTALAAQNPFSDVPADSWAYDAVKQLADNGIVDGYPDGTYQGQSNMTRYEMAQIVARAMTKTDLDKADKVLVDKLASEFADELDNFGVRISELEKKSDNVKWDGTIRYRYTDVEKSKSSANKTENTLLFRLNPRAYIGNTGWTANSRIEYLGKLDTSSNFDTTVDRIWVEGPAFGVNWKLGKYPVLPMNGMLLDDKVTGVEATFGSDVFKTTLQAGRFNTDVSEDHDLGETTSDYYAVQFDYAKDKWTAQAGYYLFDGYYKANTISTDELSLTSRDFDTDDLSLWNVGLGYKFDNNFKIAGNYAENTKGSGYNTTGTGTVKGDESKSYNVELTYKGFNVKDPGSWDAFIAYRYVGAMVSVIPVYKGAWTDQKGIEVGIEFVPAENILATLKYFDGKDISTDKDANKWFGQVEFQF